MNDLAKVTAGASALIFLIGCFGVYRPLETAIAMQSARLLEAQNLIELRRRHQERGPQLMRERNRIARQLEIAGVTERPTLVVERFLRITQRLASNRRLSVVAMVGTGVATLATPEPSGIAPALDESLQEIPFDLTIRGDYASVLDLVQQFGRADLPVRVAITSITSDQDGTSASHELTAILHVILECIAREQPLVHRPV